MSLMAEMDRLIRENRLAHGYVVDGDPLGAGKAFATDLIVRLFAIDRGTDPAQVRHRVEGRIHPDVVWVEPRGALRQIRVEDVGEALHFIHEKSFEGGWKAVVFLGAERMNPASGNRLLKSLEEPPPKTLLLLVTLSPQQLLPTLRSRCQFLVAPRDAAQEAPWMPALLNLLREGPPRTLRQRLLRAARFRDFFLEAAQGLLDDAAGDGAEGRDPLASTDDAEEILDRTVEAARQTAARRQLQRQMLAIVEAWYRDVLALRDGAPAECLRFPNEADTLRSQSESVPFKSIFKILENIREAAYRLEGNLPVQVVLEGCIF